MIKVGLDLGNSKISCVVCDIKLNKHPKILSFVNLPTFNINKSAILKSNLSSIFMLLDLGIMKANGAFPRKFVFKFFFRV